ncbi:helix-turn-helix domain-containing protein [Endozoicomonas sp. Mp262]|uniref:helix-turn-helix domain-containing protein n=1 Tax=Endozoicomonas sp. Mp262 TaxID=2919499 RepID=UPI0021DAB37C
MKYKWIMGKEDRAMHHYVECGLSYVYLENGFHIEVIDGEEYVSVDDVDSLHEVIGRALVDKPSALDGKEARFLRVEMNLSQKRLGELLNVQDQSVARWEKNQIAMPRAADVLLRSLYLESIRQESHVGHLLQVLAESDAELAIRELTFREIENHWQRTA